MYYKLGVADFMEIALSPEFGARPLSHQVRATAKIFRLCVCVRAELSNNCIGANSQRTHRVKGISYAQAAWYGALALKSLLSFTCS